MLKHLPVLLLLAAAGGCATERRPAEFDAASHVDRVLEDVTAMVEGMAAAHSERRVVLREPGFRSAVPPPSF